MIRTVIGSAEFVDLPDFGVRRLRAKVDTGARTSALHVHEIHVGAGRMVSFRVVVDPADPGRDVPARARLIRRSRVRSSNGSLEERVVVRTVLRLGSVEKEIELSLTSRGEMRYRMLLGRLAMGHDFSVHPDRRYVTSRKKKKKAAAKKSAATRPSSRRKS